MMNFKAFHMSERGESHLYDGRVCQDSSASFSDECGTVAVVSDGHGGCDYVRSQIGSAMACEAAVKNIRRLFENISPKAFLAEPDMMLIQLEAAIINDWNESVRSHYEANPFTEEELDCVSEKAGASYRSGHRIERAYGATLIAAAVTRDYWFGIQIGDGKCAAFDEAGICTQPIPWDEKCFLNKTTSICGSDALRDFRHFYSEKIPTAVFMGSDGIDDSFKNEEDMYDFYKTILYAFSISDYTQAVDELKAYLPRLSKEGSADDVSIAAWMDMDALKSVVDKIKAEGEEAEEPEENKKTEEEKETIENEKSEEGNEAEEGKKAEEEIETAETRKEENYESRQQPRFCCMCGVKLVPGQRFCQCGARILLNAVEVNPDDADGEKKNLFYYLERFISYHL
ncbi:MAG: PP2C family serine/threonine-protein phosphatase [Coprococcus sp.]